MIQTSDAKGTFGNLLRAIDLFGLTDSIGEPGEYTCFGHLDMFDLEVGILPGNFSAQEIAELYKAAAIRPAQAEPQAFQSPQAA